MSESVHYVFDTNTGNSDLLVLHPFRNTAIVTPAEFLQAIEKEETGGRG
jgi:predicted nucleic acid-binding protein